MPSRQKEAGARLREETRQRLLVAAGEEFTVRGYVGATVAHIAERAGVSVQTLYLAWGSKRELLRAHTERVLSFGEHPSAYFARQLAESGETEPRDVVRWITSTFMQVTDRAAGAWSLHIDASAVDAQVAEDWKQLQDVRLGTMRGLVALIPPDALRGDAESSAETLWAIASPETFRLFTHFRGLGRDDYSRWLESALIGALLRPDAGDVSDADAAASV